MGVERIVEQAEETILGSIERRIDSIEGELRSLDGKTFGYMYARELVDAVNDLWDVKCATEEAWKSEAWTLTRDGNDVTLIKGRGPREPYIPGR